MNLRQKLLTVDIIVLLIIAVFALSAETFNFKETLTQYFIPIMLSAYFVGRYIPLQIVKRHLKNQQ